MPGARCTRGLVCQKCALWRTRAYRAAETLRHPLRNGFTAYFVLSPVSEFVLSPSPAKNLLQAWHQQRVSGPHDLAVRLDVSSGAQESTPHAEASITSPALRFVTIAKRPSCGPGTGRLIVLICRNGKQNIFA